MILGGSPDYTSVEVHVLDQSNPLPDCINVSFV